MFLSTFLIYLFLATFLIFASLSYIAVFDLFLLNGATYIGYGLQK